MRKHRLGKQLLIVLCVVLIVFLAGCRPSPVLEQIIYEQNHEVDPDTETKTLENDLENEEPDEDIPSRETVDDSEQEKDEEYTAALAGDEDTDPDAPLDAVYGVKYSPNGELSEPDKANPTENSTSENVTGTKESDNTEEEGPAPSDSEEGEEPGTEGESSDEAKGGGEGTGEDAQGSGESSGAEPTDGSHGNGSLNDGATESGEGFEPGDPKDRTMMEFVDERGEKREIPTNVDTVAAPGEAATIVEMLDSNGRLIATSSSFTENSFAQSAFDLTGVSVCWNGDGSSPNCDNFNALLVADPDVCFVISGQPAFSEAQIATLKERNIGYVTLPQLNSIENIEYAVDVVGQVLDTRTTEGVTNNAGNVADNYRSWADSTINRVSGYYSTKATAYIGRWDDDASWTIQSTQGRGVLQPGGSGYGVPVGMAYNDTSPLAECMGYAGVSNSASNNYYVEPLYSLQWEPVIYEASAKYRPDYISIIKNNALGVSLGTANYPAVIVAESQIRDYILDGDYYLYHWQAGQIIPQEVSKTYGIPLPDGTFLATRIQNEQAYKILVNPSGVGDWAKGSVESPLEALWLAYEFQGAFTRGDVENEVRNFYSMFYNDSYQVDTSQVMPADWTYPG